MDKKLFIAICFITAMNIVNCVVMKSTKGIKVPSISPEQFWGAPETVVKTEPKLTVNEVVEPAQAIQYTLPSAENWN
jgi:hypothetical protein